MKKIPRIRIVETHTLDKAKALRAHYPNPVSFDNFDIKNGLTQSLLNNLVCPKRMLFALNGFYLPEKEWKTNCGSIVHDVLDKVYMSKQEVTEERIDSIIIKYKGNFVDDQQMELDKAKAFAMLAEYIIFYKTDFTEKTFEYTEKKFDIDFRGYRLRGKKDGLYRDKNKKIWILENKTKGQINEDVILKLVSFDFQCQFYTLAEETERGEQVHGVLYNIIRNPQSRPLKGETLHQFTKRLRFDICRKPEHYFKRYEVIYTKQDKDIFAYELALKLMRLQKFLDGTEKPYKEQSACENPWACEYLSACASKSTVGYKTREL